MKKKFDFDVEAIRTKLKIIENKYENSLEKIVPTKLD